MQTDPSNADAAHAWNGTEGEYWAEHVDTFERSVARYDDRLLGLLGAGDRVLDIGCGTGSLTRAAARRAAAVVGIDLSAAMLAVAGRRAKAAGLRSVRFIHGDAQIEPFVPESFEVALSRTGVMFFGDPVAAFGNIRGALRPGGRLVLLVWQALACNEWICAVLRAVNGDGPLPVPPSDAPGPFSLSDPARVRAILGAAGFIDVALEGLSEPMYVGPDAEAAFRFLSGLGVVRGAIDGLAVDAADRARTALRATIDEHAGPDGVQFASAAWLVTARVGE